MKKISFILLMIMTSISLFGQVQNVKGIVTDKETGYPLPGAEVSIRTGQKILGAVTGFDGQYKVYDVPIGKITITVKYLGYESKTLENVELESGKELVVNFELIENVSQLNTVVIQGEKRNEQVAFVTGSNYELKAKQIDRYAGSFNDVSRMAMNYAGVSSNNDSRNDIIVRGNNPNSLLWMMEGISIPNPNHYSSPGSSGGPISMINVNTLGKSNFIAGAFPANFGNTTSAAFDLNFRTPNKDKYEYVGQLGFTGVEAGIEGPISKGNSSFLLDYRYSALDLFNKMGFNLGVGTAIPQYQDATMIVDFSGNQKSKLRLWAIGGKSYILIKMDGKDEDNLYLDMPGRDIDDNSTIITGLKHRYFFNKKWRMTTALSYSRLNQRMYLDTINPNDNIYYNYFHNENQTDYLTYKTEIKNKVNARNTWAIGTETTWQKVRLTTRAYYLDYTNSVNHDAILSGAYILWKHKFTDRFILTSGVRLQYFSLNKQSVLEPRLGIKYKFGQRQQNISFGYGLHSNIHSLLAYYSKTQLHNGSYAYLNKNIKMMRAHHFILSYSQVLGEHLHSKIELYYQYLFDVPVDRSPGSTYSIINSGYTEHSGAQYFFPKLYNDGKGKNYGVDLTLEYPLNQGFYMLMTGSLYQSLYQANNKKWYHTAWDGNYMMSLLAGKEWSFKNNGALHIDITMNYSGGRRMTPLDKQASEMAGQAVYDYEHTFEKQLPFYFRTDFKISYKKSGKKVTHEWQLDIRNVTNRQNVFSQHYNATLNKIVLIHQTGLLPVLQYRILF